MARGFPLELQALLEAGQRQSILWFEAFYMKRQLYLLSRTTPNPNSPTPTSSSISPPYTIPHYSHGDGYLLN